MSGKTKPLGEPSSKAPPCDGKHEKKLPSNVTRTRGKIVKRYGVKIRFKGHGLRIGSAYCTPEDASEVASAFRRVARIDDFGNIQFDNLLYSTYKNVHVNIYLPFTTTIDSISVCDLLTKWLSEIKKKPVQTRTKKGTKNEVPAKKVLPDVGEYKASKSTNAERDRKGSLYPKSAVLGKRGPKSACRVEYPLLKKSVRRCDLGEETIEKLKMKIDLLESENTMLKEMAGPPLLSVKERDGSTTCSSESTTSSSGDEKGDYDESFNDMESVLLPSYKPLFVSIIRTNV